jgi:ribosome-binding factor A
MPTSHRIGRVQDLMQRTLANLLQHANDPRFAKATITHVDVSPDLANAKVYVSLLDENAVKETLSALNKAAGFFRHHLAEEMDLRVTPKVHFCYDATLQQADRIAQLLDANLPKEPKDSK